MKALLLLGVLFTLCAATTTLAADAAAETAAAIPVPAEDVEELAFDAEVDKALQAVATGELAVEAEDVDADADLDQGVSADETELLSESESVSVAVAETDGEEESASAQVDADEDAAFIEFEAEEKQAAEEDSEEEAEADSEAEEGSYSSEAESVTFERDAEDMQVVDPARLMESAADVQAHARATALTGTAVEAETSESGSDSNSNMVEVSDFNTEALAEADAKADAPVATSGSVRAGVAGATIETAKPVEAEALPVTKEVLTVVEDSVARQGGYALVETEAAVEDEDEEESEEEAEEESEEEGEDESEDESEEESEDEEEESDEAEDESEDESEEESEEESEDTSAADSEEQQLALMHSMLLSIREHSGKAVEDAITPDEMDLIEEKLATTSMIETSDATATAAAGATAAAADTEHKAEAKTEAKAEAKAEAKTEAKAEAKAETAAVATAAAATEQKAEAKTETAAAATGPLVVKPNESPRVDAVTVDGKLLHKVKVFGVDDKPKKRRSKYRYDVHYDDEHHRHGRRAEYRGDIELTDKPMWNKGRDYTKVSLKNPKKPVILKPKKFLRDSRPAYRYDVTYEKRARCCERREACCIKSSPAKRAAAKRFTVSGSVRIEVPRPVRSASGVETIVAFDHVDHEDHIDHDDHIHYPQFDHYDIIRPPQSKWRGDVEYAAPQAPRRRNVVTAGVKSRSSFNAQEFDYLKRIHERQRLLHKLLQTHPAEYVDEHELANFVYSNEPASAAVIQEGALLTNGNSYYDAFFPRRFRSDVTSVGSEQLSPAEFRELQDWLSNLPRVPELSVVELASTATATKKWVAPKIVPGLIDLTHEDNTEEGVMERLTQIPEPAVLLAEAEQVAIAEDSVEEDEAQDETEESDEAEAEAVEADEEEAEEEAEEEVEDL